MDGISYGGENVVAGDSDSQIVFDSPEDCQAACYSEPECVVWSYHKNSHLCYLKKTNGNAGTDTNYISGPKYGCNGKCIAIPNTYCH